ncbi:unnamed protein product [Calypogeia fissa]
MANQKLSLAARVPKVLEKHRQIQAEEWKDSASDVRIVNPDTLEEVGDGVEGEIWLSSPNNGVGYWEMPEVTSSILTAKSVDCTIGEICQGID